ncbi:hypothetical protein F5Y09DRAFT_114201 [Xylaria sp. FL1042]|nr:hypothetical protein F5Y09DRAFT_114201 [Xylaria sp. FL1042]
MGLAAPTDLDTAQILSNYLIHPLQTTTTTTAAGTWRQTQSSPTHCPQIDQAPSTKHQSLSAGRDKLPIMLFSIGRSAARQLASTALATSSARSVVFRAATKVHFGAPGLYRRFPQAVRGFATAGQPKKASTSAGTKKTSAKKPAKKSTSKTKAKPKSKAQPKSKSKAKAKPKPKAKATKARKAKKPISEERKAILDRQQLKRNALFTEPKLLPAQAWLVYVAEQTQGLKGERAIDKMPAVSQEYKNLSSSEMQRLKSKVEQAKATNEVNYKAWLESHTPQQIYNANLARKNLKRKYNIPKGNVKVIHDYRLPKRPSTAYGLFTKARWASGDYSAEAGLASKAASIAQDWKNLTAAERKPYEDQARSEAESYHKVMDALVSRRKTASKSPSP